MLGLLPTPEQREIATAAHGLFAAEWPLERLRDWAPAEPGRWSTLVELGIFGLALPVDADGLGLSCVEQALVMREAGRFVLPPRVLATALAAQLAHAAGQADRAARMLAGTCSVGLLNPAGAHGLGPRIDGRFQLLDARDCELVLAWNKGGAVLVKQADLPAAQELACIDDTVSLATCTLQGVPALAWSAGAAFAWRADVLLAACLVGIAEAARDMAVAYAGLRQAFGQPIGAFQAIKHRCADMAVAAEAAWCQTLAAAIGLRDGSPHAGLEAAAARWLAADAAQRNAEGNVQVHGGIGFCAEALPHRLVKRAVVAAGWGAVGRHLAADLVAPVSQTD